MQLLSDSELNRVYAERVRPQLFGAGRPSANPRLVIVGGQPGAGKTLATLSAVRELGRAGDAVAYINGDELRPLHPRYAALVAADNTTAADKTGTDVGLWVERGIREAAEGRISSVIETTMRQPAVVRRTAEQFTKAGFEFEMRVVVADPELSRLAIYERFARALGTPGALPRFTLPSYHTDALAQIPATLRAVATLAKVVLFVNRQGGELYSVLIRLFPRPTTCSRLLCSGIELSIGWRGDIARNPKQGAERVERIEAAIEAERELVEVCL